jgi:hypothetical protein
MRASGDDERPAISDHNGKNVDLENDAIRVLEAVYEKRING